MPVFYGNKASNNEQIFSVLACCNMCPIKTCPYNTLISKLKTAAKIITNVIC